MEIFKRSCMQVDSHNKWLNDVVAHCENGVSSSAISGAAMRQLLWWCVE